MITDLIAANRSCRRFDENHALDLNTLEELVDLARLSASGANLQPLKYILTCRPELNAEIFRCLGWAAYLQDWAGPQSGERPAAYIVILGDSNISKDFGVDHGIAAQSILLGARDKGLAGCMIGSINRKDLRAILNVQSHLKILLALAIGKPKEKIVIETVGPDGDIRYWRDEQAVHHVPKRSLSEIIVASHAV
ncbi:MAG: nitroreductase family protein [Desulfobacterales bacterium]|jgi:nitroreductase|nr:nitroreductase family protein [Deltaproteobacteria bacterium]